MEVVTKDLVPALDLDRSSNTNSDSSHEVVSPDSLLQWLTTHYPANQFQLEEKGRKEGKEKSKGQPSLVVEHRHYQSILGQNGSGKGTSSKAEVSCPQNNII